MFEIKKLISKGAFGKVIITFIYKIIISISYF